MENIENIAIILNPSSAKGRSLKRKDEIEFWFKELGLTYDLFISRSESHLQELAAEKAGQYPVIVAAGGDTTFNIVAREILKIKAKIVPETLDFFQIPRMGMIGTGSANDMVRALGIHKIEDACKAIKRNQTIAIDVGHLEINTETGKHDITFLGTVSAGLGTTVNRYIEEFLQRHQVISKIPPFNQLLPGLLGMSRSFSKKQCPLFARLRYAKPIQPGSVQQHENLEDNEIIAEKEVEFSLLTLLNSPYYANGLKLGPENALGDGLLDVCVINTRSFWETISVGLKTKKGTHIYYPGISVFQSPRIDVFPQGVFDIQVDGDIWKNVNQFCVSLYDRGLEVLA